MGGRGSYLCPGSVLGDTCVKDNAALAHLVNLVQLVVGKVEHAADKILPGVDYQDVITRRLVFLWWASLAFFLLDRLFEWADPLCR